MTHYGWYVIKQKTQNNMNFLWALEANRYVTKILWYFLKKNLMLV